MRHEPKKSPLNLISQSTIPVILTKGDQKSRNMNRQKQIINLTQSNAFGNMVNVYDSLLQPCLENSAQTNKENFDPNFTLISNLQIELYPKKQKKKEFSIQKDLFLKFIETEVSVLGTRFYRSPEHLTMIQQDLSSEIWGLGCIFLETLKFCVIAHRKRNMMKLDMPQGDYVLKKFAKKGPIFRGKKCELFSISRKQNYKNIEKFRKLISKFIQLNENYLKREMKIRFKHKTGISKTEPRSLNPEQKKSKILCS